MKPLLNYLAYFMNLEAKKTPIRAKVIIAWSEAILLEKYINDELSLDEQNMLENQKIIYIFVGENDNGEKALDVGQTSNSLLQRINEHLRDKDYLEGYPQNQQVYCGIVNSQVEVNRELLEQIEGIVIQHFTTNISESGYHLCNDSKTKECKKSLVRHILNRNIPNNLKRLLSRFIIIRKI